ncbi:LysR substrate-binding domain-containing protein [soil metagenome]
MSPFDLVTLRLFTLIVEHRSIAGAARANNIAASAVSKRVSDLEATLGIALLYRLRDGVEPTPGGHALYRHAKQIDLVIRDLQGELSEYSQGARGHVRLWANTSAVTQFLPEDLAAFVEQYPNVDIDLHEGNSDVVVNAVTTGMADIGIYSEYFGTTELVSRIYRRDTMMLVVPLKHPLAGREKVRFEETTHYDHVGLQEGSSLQERVLTEASNKGLHIRTRVHTFGFDGIRRMVEAGLGIAILPQGAVLPYVGQDNFWAAALDEPWAKRTLYLVYRDYESLPVVARALIECLAPDDSAPAR